MTSRKVLLNDIYLVGYLHLNGIQTQALVHKGIVVFEVTLADDLLWAMEEYRNSPFFAYASALKQVKAVMREMRALR